MIKKIISLIIFVALTNAGLRVGIVYFRDQDDLRRDGPALPGTKAPLRFLVRDPLRRRVGYCRRAAASASCPIARSNS